MRQVDRQTERRALPRWRVVRALLELTRGAGQLLSHREVPWASITFSGTRHTVQLQFIGKVAVDAGEALIVALPEHEFRFPGALVADATIGEVSSLAGPPPRLMVSVDLLLLDEAG